MNPPILSICLLAFNHEEFIEQAIESIIAQSIFNECEVIIGEDGSTDQTMDILRRYDSLPNVRLVAAEKNEEKLCINGVVTGRRNLLRCLNLASGKYVIRLDGDDYWIDPRKLEKQVSLLESNDEFSFCYHDNYRKLPNGALVDYPNYMPNSPDSTLIDRSLIPHTSTVMFRNFFKEPWPTIFYAAEAADVPLYIYAMGQGKGCSIDEKMSVYRIHEKGIWTGRTSPSRALQLLQHILVLRHAHRLLGNNYGKYRLKVFFTIMHFKLRALKNSLVADPGNYLKILTA